MMTILFIDDLEVYDTVRGTGNMDLTWLNRAYEVRQTVATGLRIQESRTNIPYVRKNLANGQSVTGQRSVYLPVGQYIADNPNITISQKLVDYVPNGTAIGGLSLVGVGVEDHLLVFGFTGPRNGFVRYVDASGIVIEDAFILPTSISGHYDTIEWSFTKEVNDGQQYRPFTLWVNNRAVYAGYAFSQLGGTGILHARILGGVSTLNPGQTSSTGYLNGGSNVVIPDYGTTDIVVTNGQRLGRARVISRTGTGDSGPNSMTPSVQVTSHVEAVNSVPPDSTRYLTASTPAAEERFWATAFPDLSSEAVLAVAVRIVTQKNSPSAMDAVPMVISGNSVYDAEVLPVDLAPRFGQLVLDKNPFTGLGWTPFEVNGTQFGIKTA